MSINDSNKATVEIGPLKITFPLNGDPDESDGGVSGEISGEFSSEMERYGQQAMPAQIQMQVRQNGQLTSRRRVDVPDVGEYWNGQGGVYAGVVYDNAAERRWYLIVPIDPSARARDLKWGPYGTDVLEAAHPSDGLANTKALIGCDDNYPAAEFAHGITVDGHNDFYLPARREIAIIEANLSHLFEKSLYWSSTQSSANTAWTQGFDYGLTLIWYKDSIAGALAVRRISL